MSEVHGTCEERFEGVRAVLASNLDSGADVGACVAIAIDGEIVVDLWGGHTSPDRAEPWAEDTLINVFSVSKTMAALSMLVLVDSDELDVDAPVAKYWPEFRANGKEGILVRHVMGHTAGLPGWDVPVTVEDLPDSEKLTSLLADQAPWWEPGTRIGYHSLTQGYLEGEIIRRITGQTIGRFFDQEIAEPLGADFHFGLAPEHDHRLAFPIPPEGWPNRSIRAASDIAQRVMDNPVLPAEQSWTVPWRRAEIPSAGGVGNARSVARIQSVVSNGGRTGDGHQLLKPETCEVILREQANQEDAVLGLPIRHGIGYALPSDVVPLPSPRTGWWAGWGGSLAMNDLDNRMTVAYVINRMVDGEGEAERMTDIVAAAYEGLAL